MDLPSPPLLLTDARIMTPEPSPPGHDCIAVVGDRIVAVGSRDEASAALPSEHRTVDLGGRVVTPGFVDAHLHPMPLCFFEHHVDLSACTDLAGVFDLLSARAAALGSDGWAMGHGLDDELLAERRLPHRTELDRVGAGHPVMVLRKDGHHAIGSTAALTAAGIHRTTPDPPGGVIHHDADGDLNGLCGESASSLLLGAVPLPSWDEFEAALDRAAARMAAHGITGISAICQTGPVGPAGASGSLESVAWSGLVDRVPFDVQTILVATAAEDLMAARDTPLHDPSRRRRLDAVKLFLDGTLGGRTACLHHPYADAGGSGMLTLGTEQAYAQMVDGHLAGLQVCIHAIGDRANRTAAELYARLLDQHPSTTHRHRVEHASVLDDRTIELFAEHRIATVVQPVSIVSERRWLRGRLGDERLGSVYPYRQLLDAGVVVAGSSDAPIETADVLAAMHAAVDRLGIGTHQAITPTEAIGLYTTGAAQVRRVDDGCGRLAAGMRADLVVLSGGADAEGSAPDLRFDRMAVDATMASGEVIHGALP